MPDVLICNLCSAELVASDNYLCVRCYKDFTVGIGTISKAPCFDLGKSSMPDTELEKLLERQNAELQATFALAGMGATKVDRTRAADVIEGYARACVERALKQHTAHVKTMESNLEAYKAQEKRWGLVGLWMQAHKELFPEVILGDSWADKLPAILERLTQPSMVPRFVVERDNALARLADLQQEIEWLKRVKLRNAVEREKVATARVAELELKLENMRWSIGDPFDIELAPLVPTNAKTKQNKGSVTGDGTSTPSRPAPVDGNAGSSPAASINPPASVPAPTAISDSLVRQIEYVMSRLKRTDAGLWYNMPDEDPRCVLDLVELRTLLDHIKALEDHCSRALVAVRKAEAEAVHADDKRVMAINEVKDLRGQIADLKEIPSALNKLRRGIEEIARGTDTSQNTRCFWSVSQVHKKARALLNA